jgi:hypothetical protein
VLRGRRFHEIADLEPAVLVVLRQFLQFRDQLLDRRLMTNVRHLGVGLGDAIVRRGGFFGHGRLLVLLCSHVYSCGLG